MVNPSQDEREERAMNTPIWAASLPIPEEPPDTEVELVPIELEFDPDGEAARAVREAAEMMR